MGFHRLPVSRYSQDSNKRVIVKFNRKYPEALLKNKKSISSKDFSHLNLFVLTTVISGANAKTCKEEGKPINSFALALL